MTKEKASIISGRNEWKEITLFSKIVNTERNCICNMVTLGSIYLMLIHPHRIIGKSVASYELKTGKILLVLFPATDVSKQICSMNSRLCHLFLHKVLPDLAWWLPHVSVLTEAGLTSFVRHDQTGCVVTAQDVLQSGNGCFMNWSLMPY